MMPNSIRVLLVDDHPVVLEGYRHMLETAPEIEVVAAAESGEAAIAGYFELQPDVVVMDLSMPGMDGLTAAQTILRRDAGARIVIFTVYDNEVYFKRALDMGVKGYLTKSNDRGPMIEAVRRAARGGTYLGQEMAGPTSKLLAGNGGNILDQLSDREYTVFMMRAAGISVDDIAEKLNLSPKTIGHHYTTLKKKLSINSAAELARIAMRYNLLDP